MVQRRLLEGIVSFCSSVLAGCRKTLLEANRLPAIHRCAIVAAATENGFREFLNGKSRESAYNLNRATWRLFYFSGKTAAMS